MSDEKQYEFTGRVVRCVWNSDNFKVFALDVDKHLYPEPKRTKYGNVSISGELPDLSEGAEYQVVGIEQLTKNGYGYKVLNIKRNEPTSINEMYLFLSEILTVNQAKVLWENYPDIVQRVKDNRLDDIDFSKLKGITENNFEKIKQKIIENFCLSDLIIEFQGYFSLSIIKRIYAKYTSIDVLRKKLKQDPYKCLCGLARVGFKTADKILLDMEKLSKKNIENDKPPIVDFDYDLKTSPQRCLACVLYLLEENETEGHTKMNLADLRTECMKVVPACAEHFAEVIKDNKNIYYDKSTMDCALQKTYDVEKSIAQTIINTLDNCKELWTFDILKYRSVDDIELSDEQLQALHNLCNNSISILNGAAGVGKTASTNAIVRMLKDNHKSFKLLSPTGKASKILSEYTHEKASTIHRGLNYRPKGFYFYQNAPAQKDMLYDYFTHFYYNKYNKLKYDVIIIDEFSMVDIFLFQSLIEAIDFTQTKLLLIGDNAQLCSVGCGNLLHDFMESKLIPTTTLTKVFRYGEGGLMKVATDVRFCKTYLDKSMKEKATVFGKNKDYMFVDIPSDTIPQNVVALYKKLLNQGNKMEDIQVLTAKNVGECGTVALNNMIQKVANPNYGKTTFMKFGDTTYYVGDFIIQKVNNYKAIIDNSYISKSTDNEDEWYEDIAAKTAFVANGETGVVKAIDMNKNEMTIDFDGIYVRYTKADLSMIGLAYSISVHKSQGSSINNVIVCTPQSHIFMCNSNLLYVALTRMRNKCYHLGSYKTVNQAVIKKANTERKTMMQHLLANQYNTIGKSGG